MRQGHGLVGFGAVGACVFGAAAGVFEFNSQGDFLLVGNADSGARCEISSVGWRDADQELIGRLNSRIQQGLGGHSLYLNPVAVNLDVTITLDVMRALGDDSPQYPGGGWRHAVRYNGDLAGWRTIWLIRRAYAPDATGFYANYAYESLDVSSYDEDYLALNYPFFQIEDRDGSTDYGEYAISEHAYQTWFTINGSWIEIENTFVLARIVGDDLEIAGGWGFREFVLVPAPGAATALAAGLLACASRRRR